MIERSRVRIPAGAAGEFTSPGSTFCTDSYFGIRPPPPPPPRVTAVARKQSLSFCQKCRWQVTAKHVCTLRMWLCLMWHGAWLYGVHRTRRDGSNFTWHQPCQRCKYTTSVDIQKTRYKKLFTHVESHASAVSLLESGEQRYIKAINNNNNTGFFSTEIRVSTESWPWGSTFSRRSCRDSNPQPFNHESGALTTELSPTCSHADCWCAHPQGLSHSRLGSSKFKWHLPFTYECRRNWCSWWPQGHFPPPYPLSGRLRPRDL